MRSRPTPAGGSATPTERADGSLERHEAFFFSGQTSQARRRDYHDPKSHSLFLKVHPSLRTARLIVATETPTPCFSSQISQWRSRVASSLASSCAHRAFLSSSVERMRGV